MKPYVSAGRKPTLEQAPHDVEKFCYVVSGKVKCSIGQDVHELKTGDSINFPVRLWRKLRQDPSDKVGWLLLGTDGKLGLGDAASEQTDE